MSENEKVFVTQPYLPPLQEFVPYLESIWKSRVLTNCGPFHERLEQALCEYLGVEHIALFANEPWRWSRPFSLFVFPGKS